MNRTGFHGLSFLNERRLIMVSGIKFEPEFKERAVWLYLERRAEHHEESLAARRSALRLRITAAMEAPVQG